MTDQDSLCKCEHVGPGLYQKKLASFEEFFRFVNAKICPNENWIFRGQRRVDWALVPSLFREFPYPSVNGGISIPDKNKWHERIDKHLSLFKQACRGRCPLDPNASDDDWWSLGQHWGLKTPLLDWTCSPYVALFFAFIEEHSHENRDEDNNRAVFMLNWNVVDERRKKADLAHESARGSIEPFNGHNRPLCLLEPYSHDNPRLVSQAGLFLFFMPGKQNDSIENRVDIEFGAQYYRNDEVLNDASDAEALIKVVIPDSARQECLEGLDRMNINYLSLFPDIEGSALHCNLRRGFDASES